MSIIKHIKCKRSIRDFNKKNVKKKSFLPILCTAGSMSLEATIGLTL